MKNIKIILFFTIAVLSMTNSSCEKDDPEEDLTIIKGFNYYPLEVGKYITYQLDSIIYHTGIGHCIFVQDSTSHFLKEEVTGTFEDNTGTTNYIIERFTRKEESAPWNIIDVWNTKISETQVERVEENLRFVKLVFPVWKGERWSGNSFLSQDTSILLGGETINFYSNWSEKYTYGTIDSTEVINGIAFDSVMTVIQSDSKDNKISYRVSLEKYARNVGLVYKEMWILDSNCCGNSGLGPCQYTPWEEKAEKGLILRQRVIDFN